MTVLGYRECSISLNDLGTSEGVSWEALEVCYVEWKEETEENLRVWLPCPIIKEFGGIWALFVCFVNQRHANHIIMFIVRILYKRQFISCES